MTNLNPISIAPFRIDPKFDIRVWGYEDLHPWFNVRAENGPLGEAWLTGDMCRVATGPHKGKQLDDLFREVHQALLGPDAPASDSPLLIKVIFAKQKLSVQVHPDDKMAQKYGDPRGKTECWYALDAEPGAQVAVGLKPGVTLQQVEQGIHQGTLEETLNILPVQRGDMIFVDAGTVHAIWPGAILLETQQNCDLTYRMYDYGRPRELHIDKAMEATRLSTRAGKVAAHALADRTVLIDTEYFRVERIPVAGKRDSSSLRSLDSLKSGLAYLFAAAGLGRISGNGFDPIELPARAIAAIPAFSPEFVVEDLGGLDLIRIVPNWPGRLS
ncbi:MAG TPA: type I phosphomannose isomerase catalytic subunit [Terracidiphilus sp.]|nr:type I phosphomannose isomerase catalytic subunit [Terracidiphilus sp.]